MIHASIRKVPLQKCRQTRERMKEGASKLARSAVASPAEVAPSKQPGSECLREAGGDAERRGRGPHHAQTDRSWDIRVWPSPADAGGPHQEDEES